MQVAAIGVEHDSRGARRLASRQTEAPNIPAYCYMGTARQSRPTEVGQQRADAWLPNGLGVSSNRSGSAVGQSQCTLKRGGSCKASEGGRLENTGSDIGLKPPQAAGSATQAPRCWWNIVSGGISARDAGAEAWPCPPHWSCLMGIMRQTTASAAPIHTMTRIETEEGTATSTSAKCLVDSA